MGNELVDKMVNRFLTWPLPTTVCSDMCATMPDYPHRTGTNLLTAEEARQMITYLMECCDLTNGDNTKEA